jgi:hypothetical protein
MGGFCSSSMCKPASGHKDGASLEQQLLAAGIVQEDVLSNRVTRETSVEEGCEAPEFLAIAPSKETSNRVAEICILLLTLYLVSEFQDSACSHGRFLNFPIFHQDARLKYMRVALLSTCKTPSPGEFFTSCSILVTFEVAWEWTRRCPL